MDLPVHTVEITSFADFHSSLDFPLSIKIQTHVSEQNEQLNSQFSIVEQWQWMDLPKQCASQSPTQRASLLGAEEQQPGSSLISPDLRKAAEGNRSNAALCLQ